MQATLAVLLCAAFAGCATIGSGIARPASLAIDDGAATALGRAFAQQLGSSPERSGLRLLASGPQAFTVRAALAEAAQRTLDLQYYLVADDETATMLMARVVRAAERGVRVRLLIDDLESAGREMDLAALAATADVQVRVFNPLRLRGPLAWLRYLELMGDRPRADQRMHNKLWIADNAAAIIGGRNLGNAYFGADAGNDFADLDMLAAGPVVADISRGFDAYWNSAWAVPVTALVPAEPDVERFGQWRARLESRAAAFRDTEYARALRGNAVGSAERGGTFAIVPADVTALHDPPTKLGADPAARTSSITPELRNLVESALVEVLIISPYFIPSPGGIDSLAAAVRRGVRVAVLTNSLASTDARSVHAAYALYRPTLLAHGIELYERRPDTVPSGERRIGISAGSALHAKAAVADRKRILLGSMNLDPRSRSTNTEVALAADSIEIGEQIGAFFDEAMAPQNAFRVELVDAGNGNQRVQWVGATDGSIERFNSEPLASWWRILLSRVLAALIPEERL